MRLIDADALKRDIETAKRLIPKKVSSAQYNFMRDAVDGLSQMVLHAPTVNAVPVALCKDCKWFRDSNGIDGFCYCDRIYRRCGTHWFCADGERREE